MPFIDRENTSDGDPTDAALPSLDPTSLMVL